MHSEEQPAAAVRLGTSSPERRAVTRPATLLRVAVIAGPGPRQLCQILDLSQEGMRVRLFTGRFPGEPIAVELPTGARKSARIIWIDGDQAGLRFETAEEGAAEPWIPTIGWRLRTPRIELDHLAMVRHGAEISFVTTRNIGPRGARFECERVLGEGRAIIFTIEGLAPMRSVVRWEDEGSCGIGFDRPLAVADLARWLDRQAERRA